MLTNVILQELSCKFFTQILSLFFFSFFWGSVIMLQRWWIPNLFSETLFKWQCKKLFSPHSKSSDLCPFSLVIFLTLSLILEHFATIPGPSLDHCQVYFNDIYKKKLPFTSYVDINLLTPYSGLHIIGQPIKYIFFPLNEYWIVCLIIRVHIFLFYFHNSFQMKSSNSLEHLLRHGAWLLLVLKFEMSWPIIIHLISIFYYLCHFFFGGGGRKHWLCANQNSR